jgi:ribosomal protein S8
MGVRLSNMIGILNSTIRSRYITCEVPTNNLGIKILRLLREQGYIYGFSYVSDNTKTKRLYPRVKVYFKYIDIKTPMIKSISAFKNAKSNFKTIQNAKYYQTISHNKLYILSTNKGLVLTSMAELYKNKLSSPKNILNGKLLVELLV